VAPGDRRWGSPVFHREEALVPAAAAEAEAGCSMSLASSLL